MREIDIIQDLEDLYNDPDYADLREIIGNGMKIFLGWGRPDVSPNITLEDVLGDIGEGKTEQALVAWQVIALAMKESKQ